MRDHKSLKAWQEAHEVVLGIIRLSRSYWRPWAGAVFGQIQRASLSVQLNIAEGWTFGASPTSTRHLSIAYGSAVETADLIELMQEAHIIPVAEIEELRAHCSRSQRLLLGLLKRRRPL
jgi:four helix bundle protein